MVLDEAQLVANSNSVAAVVASSLWRRQAWVVTGTPLSSRDSHGLDEIKGAVPPALSSRRAAAAGAGLQAACAPPLPFSPTRAPSVHPTVQACWNSWPTSRSITPPCGAACCKTRTSGSLWVACCHCAPCCAVSCCAAPRQTSVSGGGARPGRQAGCQGGAAYRRGSCEFCLSATGRSACLAPPLATSTDALSCSPPAALPPRAAHELQLPPCTFDERWVVLSPVERLCYEQSRREFCEQAQGFASHQAAAAAAAARYVSVGGGCGVRGGGGAAGVTELP